jgi:signal transduction histidine kinase/ligand-binding sensor domain-containing protein
VFSSFRLFTRTACVALAFLLFIQTGLFAQKKMRFERLSLEQGLSQSNVLCILQDKRGFLWIGSQDGLNRFDGYAFTVFRHSARAQDLADGYIQALYEDDDGMIWVGTKNGGLSMFDYRAETFTNFGNGASNNSANNNSANAPGLDIRVIVEDDKKNLWLATNDGLGKFDKQTKTFSVYKNLFKKGDAARADAQSWSSNEEIYALAFDASQKTLWVGAHKGLTRFLPAASRALPLETAQPINSIVHSICISRNNAVVWVGTESGLYTIDKKDFSVAVHRHERGKAHIFSGDNIRALCEDSRGTLWIGTYGGGVFECEPATKKFTAHRHDREREGSLSHDFIQTIYEDRAGIIWIGVFGGGINKYDPSLSKFELYTYEPTDAFPLSDQFVYSFWEDKAGTLWVGTSNGLNKLINRAENAYRSYFPSGSKTLNAPANIIRAIYEDAKGRMWIATGDGFFRFDARAEKFTLYPLPKKVAGIPDTSSFSYDIVEDAEGMLWIGSLGGGVYRFNPETGRFIAHYTHESGNPNSLCHNSVYALLFDKLGRLWIGTSGGGVSILKPKTQEFVSYKYDPALSDQSLSGNTVRVIYEDAKGNIWLGTSGGLNRFHPDKNSFSCVRDRDGLPNNIIYGITEDNKGNLWLSTNRGLCQYSPTETAKNRAFRNYDVSDGLQSNEFNIGAYHKAASGQMYFGGIRGFNAFYPDSVRRNMRIPSVFITALKKLNAPASTPEAISVTKEIEIPAEDNIITFEFVALNFTLPEKNVYAYKLEGFNDSWVYCGSRREATYTNLGGGTYTFRVKAANNDGVWNEEGASIRVVILPRWYLRWWALSLWFALAVAGAFAAYKWRVKAIEERNRALQQTVDERTREVQRQIAILNELAQEIELANTELQDRNNQVEKQNIQFAEINQQLNEKNQLLDQTLAELHSLNQELESRIQERTIELKQAKDALEKSLVQEKEINTLRARLIASISHEFRTPITVIQSSCGILQRYIDKMSPEQRQKQFSHIEESSKRLVSILDAVITMSSIENRQLRLMPADVVRRTEEIVRDLNFTQMQEFGEQARTIAFSTNVPTTVMNIDEESLRQVLSNIISNAIKFSPAQSTIEVAFTQKEETVLWSVKDEGGGIDEEDLPYIFDLFYRSEKTESSTIQGVGLGLSIVKKLVEIMQGKIWFETEQGVGTTFFVEIPMITHDFI